MVGMQYEEIKLRQQNIEVKALIALMRFGRSLDRKIEAETRLCRIAFPETVAEEINKDSVIEKWL